MSDFIKIETERLILRKFKEADAFKFYRYRTNPKVMKYQSEGWKHFKLSQSLAFCKEQSEFEPGIPDTWFQLAIEHKKSSLLIGDCAIHTLKENIHTVEIGYTIEPIYQNEGYATEAVEKLIEYIFNVLKKEKIKAITHVENTPSIKLIKKIGMKLEKETDDELHFYLMKNN